MKRVVAVTLVSLLTTAPPRYVTPHRETYIPSKKWDWTDAPSLEFQQISHNLLAPV